MHAPIAKTKKMHGMSFPHLTGFNLYVLLLHLSNESEMLLSAASRHDSWLNLILYCVHG
jgi:hypothetical protein